MPWNRQRGPKVREEEIRVDDKRSEFLAKSRALAATQTIGPQVTLNVGGHKFQTTTTTLRNVPDSMLEAMFSGRHAIHRGEDGSYFIDRDGTYFRHILNHLRDGSIPTQLCAQEKMEIANDSAFYGLEGLQKALLGDVIANELPEDVYRTRQGETELRKLFD